MQVSQTNRLVLSKITKADASFIFNLMNSPHWIKFIGDKNIKTIADAERHIQNVILNGYQKNDFGFYKVEPKDIMQPVGICGLIKREQLDFPDIGFAFLPEFQGRGYGFESSLAVLKMAKAQFKISKVGAITLETNKNSINLIQKLGLSFEKKIKPFDNEEELLLFAKEL